MNNFKIFSASAGSGKTHRLTLEYISLILDNPSSVRNILAITFTNKAAAEMKSRILRELALMAFDSDHSKMMHALVKQTGRSVDWLNESAEKALRYLLHNYSFVSVMTIDSFMQRIIRSFARDLGLPMNFEVMVEENEIRDAVMNNLIARINRDPLITNVFIDIISDLLEDDKRTLDFRDAILPMLLQLSKEQALNFIDIIREIDLAGFQKIRSECRKKLGNIASSNKQLYTDVSDFIKVAGLTEDDFATYNRISFRRILSKMAQGVADFTTKTEKMLLSAERSLLKDPDPDKESVILEKCSSYIKNHHRIKEYKAFISKLSSMALVGEMSRLREQYKEENSSLPVSSFNELIAKVVLSEPVPYIYLRAGERYKYIMIDEFQDTSKMQWHNIVPLLNNALAANNMCLVVGDPKQSIYRFRGGEKEIMLSLPAIYAKPDDMQSFDDAEAMFLQNERIQLNQNYRSGKAIVELNNSFFLSVAQRLNSKLEQSLEKGAISNTEYSMYEGMYKDAQQESKSGKAAYWSVHLASIEQSSTKAYKQQTLAAIADIINNWVACGGSLSDIAILTRSRIRGNEISSYLLQLEKPLRVVSDESLMLSFNPTCRLLASLVRLFMRPDDDINSLEVAILLGEILPDVLEPGFMQQQFSATHGKKVGDVLIERLFDKYPSIRSIEMDRLTISRRLDTWLYNLNLASAEDHYPVFMREAVVKWQTKEGSNPEGFWKWWTEEGKNSSVIIPNGEDAVRVLTLHKSKGLQFPVVILPFFDFDDLSKIWRNPVWVKMAEDFPAPVGLISPTKSLENTQLESVYLREHLSVMVDIINMMYVAMTRPEKAMHILAKSSSGEYAEILGSPGLMLKEFLFSTYGAGNIRSQEMIQWTEYNGGELEKQINAMPAAELGAASFSISKHFVNDSMRKPAFTGRIRPSLKIDNRMRGLIMHEGLSYIIHSDEVEMALSRLIANGSILQSDVESWRIEFNRIVSLYPQIFNSEWRVLSEQDILIPQTGMKRPDRILIDENNKVVIIDYKTGIEKNDHIVQLKEYADLLEIMGYTIKDLWILYIDSQTAAVYLKSVLEHS